VTCPHCGEPAKFQRWQAKSFVSAVGSVRMPRAYYYCRPCGRGHCPWEAILGLTSQDLTPGACELTSLVGVVCPFEEVSQRALPKLAGIRICESTAQRTTERAGQRLSQALEAGATFGKNTAWDWSKDASGRSCAYVSLDATGVGQQGPRGAKTEGKMVYVGMVFNARDDHPSQARYLAGLYELDELGLQMRRQGGQVGMDAAKQWIALTDGGAGLEEFMQRNFPRAECILDFFHASEHLNDLAKSWHPQDESQARELGKRWSHDLKHEGGAAVLKVLEALDLRGRSPATREVHRKVTQYVRNNVHRMDYPRYRENGWLIGSGHIEAACKTIVGQRLKGSGMRWGEDGAHAVSSLRALFKSEPDQWDTFWATAAAA
jgi:hypothetical protein